MNALNKRVRDDHFYLFFPDKIDTTYDIPGIRGFIDVTYELSINHHTFQLHCIAILCVDDILLFVT